MEVKQGYKQTEVGVIPEEWEVRHLSCLANIVRGSSPRPAGDRRFFNGDFIPWLTVAALTNINESELYVHDTTSSLTQEGSWYSRTLERDTLIIANSGATLGVAKILGVKCCANDGIAALINQTAGDKRFICHYLNSQTKYLREVVATGNGQPNLNTGLIGNISIPFPSLPEQRAIAAALSDVDAMITALDQLIAKKHDLKQAAMQQLLTGQRRLPGFHGEWETRRLGEIATISMGRTPSRQVQAFWGGGNPWLSIADLKSICVSETKETISDLATKNMTAIPKGTLLMSFKLTIGKLAFAGRDMYSNEAICAFGNLTADAMYLYYALTRTDFSLYGKQAVKGYTLNSESLGLIEVRLPELPEQTAIASLLSDMDAEIVALEQRREKIRHLKQGMMQELLTGRTRLG